MRSNRGGQKEKDNNQELFQARGEPQIAQVEQRSQNHPGYTKRRALARCVHARVHIPQPQQAERSGQEKKQAKEQKDTNQEVEDVGDFHQ